MERGIGLAAALFGAAPAGWCCCPVRDRCCFRLALPRGGALLYTLFQRGPEAQLTWADLGY
jgi:hypothetical protein